MSQKDNRSSSAGKRARTDGGRREDDWACPKCGNVNFSFRTTCNMRNCVQPRPVDHNAKSVQRSFQTPPPFTTSTGYMNSIPPTSMYLGGSPYGSTIFNGSTLQPYDMPYSGNSVYRYDYGSRVSVGSPYGPLQMSVRPPYPSGSMLGTGGMYGMPPMMERYGVGFPMGHGPMGMRPDPVPNGSSPKKPAGRENDWVCPNCGNINFSFRTFCNMRSCNTPRPGSQVSRGQKAKDSKLMPDGSWKCEKCGNINYPFRTKCNRQNCGAERLSDEIKGAPDQTTDGDEK